MEKGFFIGHHKGVADKSGNKLDSSLKKEKKSKEERANKIQNELQDEANLIAAIADLRSGKSSLRGKEREDALDKKEAQLEKARLSVKAREAREDIERLKQEAKNAQGGEVRNGFIDKTKAVDYDQLIKEKTEKLRRLEAEAKGEVYKETKDEKPEEKKEDAETKADSKGEEKPKKLTPEEEMAKYFGKDESTVAKTYESIDSDKEIDSNFGKTAETPKRPLEEILKEMHEKNQQVIDAEESDYEKAKREIDAEGESGSPKPETPGGSDPERPATEGGLAEKWKNVEDTRKAYLEIDYKKKTGYKRLGRFFGGILKTGYDKDYEKDEEVAQLQALYENALFDYKTAALDDAKSKNLSNKELGDFVKLFDTETKLGLAEGHDNVKFENHDHRVLNWAKKGVDWYKKQPLITKMAVGAGFGLASMGSIYAGATAMAVVGGAVALRRIFMGMVTGTSVALGAEALTKKMTSRRIEKDTAKFTAGLENLSYEEKLKRVEESLNGKIKAEDGNIKKIKNKNLRNLGLGVLAGLAVSGLYDKIVGLLGNGSDIAGNVEVPKGGGLDLLERDSLISGGGDSFVETAKPGDSVWKMAERQLEQHFGEKFTDLEGPEKTHIIDAIKDKVAADPQAFGLENIDQVSAGQQIDFSGIVQNNPDIDNILGTGSEIGDEAYSSISENNEAVRTWVENHPGENLTSEKVEEIINGTPGMAEVAAESPEVPGQETAYISNETAETQAAEQIEIKDFSTELQGNLNELTGDNPMARAANWDAIDDMKVEDAIRDKHPNMPHLDQSITNIKDKYVQVIGMETDHLPNETIKEWIARVTHAASERAK